MAIGEIAPLLSLRQLRALALHAEGKTFSEIGSEIHISEWTVKRDLDQLRSALEASNLSHALMLAIGRGYLAVDGRSGRAFIPEQFDDVVVAA